MNPLHIGQLSIPVPIIQGGMGIGVSLSGLASAVANLGGVGVISAVGLGLIYGSPNKSYRRNNIEGVRFQIQKARSLTSGVLGVNIMSVQTNYSDLAKAAIEQKIDIIFSGAGLPLDLPKYLTKGSETMLVPIVSSARAAFIITNKWKNNFNYLPDAFVVEGPEAGGHLGFKPEELSGNYYKLEDLVTEVILISNEIKAKYGKNVPVIAAGGIRSGKDIFKYLSLGASAVQIGTRFIATEECDASQKFKDAIINSDIESIKIINSPVGMPGRALENNFLIAAKNGEKRPMNCKYHCIKSCNPKSTSYCIAEALLSAYNGNLDKGFVFSGAKGYEVNSLSTVAEIFTELINEFEVEKLKSKEL